jgi:hypothetical protein
MKKIITFICVVLLCIWLNSCAVYTIDDNYGYRSGSCYHTHSVYYIPGHYHTCHRYSKPIQPRHKPKPTPHPHSYRPHNSRHNHNRR